MFKLKRPVKHNELSHLDMSMKPEEQVGTAQDSSLQS